MSGDTRHSQRPIIAGLIGNTLEWYDFALYGYFAPTLAKQFFPSTDPLASLMATFAVFAAGYLTRPLGGLVIGHIADRSSRTRALQLSILMMAGPTFLMGLLPSHAQVGILASGLLVILRLAQGMSVGGEFTASITFLSDVAPDNRRSFVTSWISVGAILGMALGSAVGALITGRLSPEEVQEWGWRVPFLGGAILGVVGLYLRRQAEPGGSLKVAVPAPVTTVLRHHKKVVVKLILGIWGFTTGYYMLFLYLSTYLSTETGLAESLALRLNTGCMLILATLVPLAGLMADWVTPRCVCLGGFLLLALVAIPLFHVMQKSSAQVDLASQLLFVSLFALLEGAMPGYMVEVFPKEIRSTGLAICYNTAAALFGGTTPLVATALIARTGDKLAPAYYLTLACLVSAGALWVTPGSSQRAASKSRWGRSPLDTDR